MKTVAIIGGSRAYDLVGQMPATLLGSLDTPFGRSSPIWRIEGDSPCFLLSRHGLGGYKLSAPFVNYRANIYALKDLGVERIVAWSGPGALHLRYRIGEFVLPHDVIDETRNRKHTFFEDRGVGFVRQYPVFCPEVTRTLRQTLSALGLDASTGVYVATEGPRLETPAEIRKYRMLGGDLVGMTLCPECFLARELELCYAPLCYVSNYAEGVREREFRPGELFEGLADPQEHAAMEAAVRLFPKIIAAVLPGLAEQSFACTCPSTMERYRRRGDLGPDWHTWFRPCP